MFELWAHIVNQALSIHMKCFSTTNSWFCLSSTPVEQRSCRHVQTWTHVSRLVCPILVHSTMHHQQKHGAPCASKLQPLFLWPRSTSPSTITPESTQDWSRPSGLNDQVRLRKNEKALTSLGWPCWPQRKRRAELGTGYVSKLMFFGLFWSRSWNSLSKKKQTELQAAQPEEIELQKCIQSLDRGKPCGSLYKPRFGKLCSYNPAGLLKWTLLCDTLVLCCHFGGPKIEA